MSNNDHRYLKILLKQCQIFAIIPNFKIETPPTGRLKKLNKIYTIFCLIAMVLLFFYSNYGRNRTIYTTLTAVLIFLDRISHMSLLIFAVSNAIISVLINGEKIKLFLHDLYEMMNKFQIECSLKKLFIITEIFIVSNLILDGAFWITTVGIYIFKYYIGRSLYFFIYTTVILLLFCTVSILKKLLKKLNSNLKTTSLNLLNFKAVSVGNHVTHTELKFENILVVYQRDLREIRRNQFVIYESISVYNKLFGYQILFATIVAIIYTLDLLMLCLTFSKNMCMDDPQQILGLITICFLWMITIFVLISLVAYACDRTVKEYERTILICYKYLNQLPISLKRDNEFILQNELLAIIEQTNRLQLKFTAAGFFNVDVTMLGFIFGSVTSYIIVAMQFIEI